MLRAIIKRDRDKTKYFHFSEKWMKLTEDAKRVEFILFVFDALDPMIKSQPKSSFDHFPNSNGKWNRRATWHQMPKWQKTWTKSYHYTREIMNMKCDWWSPENKPLRINSDVIHARWISITNFFRFLSLSSSLRFVNCVNSFEKTSSFNRTKLARIDYDSSHSSFRRRRRMKISVKWVLNCEHEHNWFQSLQVITENKSLSNLSCTDNRFSFLIALDRTLKEKEISLENVSLRPIEYRQYLRNIEQAVASVRDYVD